MRITVVDQNNVPLPDVEVELEHLGESGPTLAPEERTAKTVDDGSAAFTRVDRGMHRVRIKGSTGEQVIDLPLEQRDERRVVQYAPEPTPSLSLEGGRAAWIVPVEGSAVWCSVNPADGRKAMEVRSFDTEGFDIVILAPGGSILQTIGRPGDQSNPRWSPDGRLVVFHESLAVDQPSRIVVMDPATAEERLLGPGLTPSWSPDESRIAFSRQTDDNWDVWTIGAKGDAPVRVTDHAAREQYPFWARLDGVERILFAGRRDGPYEIWSVSPDGKEPTRFARAPNDQVLLLGPTVSPDGHWVAWWSMDRARKNVWLAPAAGGDPRLVAERAANPTWSSDEGGLKLYFDSRAEGPPQVYWTRPID